MTTENSTSPPPLPLAPDGALDHRRRHLNAAHTFVHRLQQSMPTVWVTLALVSLNLLVFVWMLVDGVSVTLPSGDDALPYGADYAPLTTNGEWWRLVTSAFVHFGIVHLAINMLCLCFVGPWLERLLGHGPFAATYLFATILSSLTGIAWQPDLILAGSSGAICGLFGAFVIVMAKLKGATDSRTFADAKVVVVVFVGINLLAGISSRGDLGLEATDNAAHVGGALAGLLTAWVVFRRSERGQMPPLRADLRLVPLLLAPLVIGMLVAGSCVDQEQFEADCLYEKLYAAQDKGQDQEALKFTDSILELFPNDADAHDFRSLFLSNLKRYAEGAAAARQALDRDPDLLTAHQSLVLCLDELEDRVAYRIASAQAVAKFPEDAMLLNHYSFALYEAKDFEGALRVINRACAEDPENGWAREHRVMLLRERDQRR